MKRTATSLCVAAAFGCIASLGAQTSTTSTTTGTPTADKAHDVTITGCLSKGADGKYMLTNARMDSPPADRSATTTATSTTAGTTTAGTTGTTTSTTSAAGAMNHEAAMAWMLAGGSDLDKHVGHKIQVTGRTSWENPMMDHSRTPDPTTSTAGTTAGTVGTSGSTTTTATEEQRKDMRGDQPRVDVQSVKMIAASCS